MSETILVADDHEANRALARETLEDEGYRVILANDGRAAVDRFRDEGADCVLLDVRMPGLDGPAACAAIRALPGGERVPILFLTALRDVDTFDRAARAGGDDFLTKPVSPVELVARVKTALRMRRVDADLAEAALALKQQRDALQRAQLGKERITAYVVHDLKNPVNVIDLHAQVLARDASLSDGARASVGQIRAASRRLLRMITNLLDVSKADEGKLTVTPTRVAVADLVREVGDELAAPAADHAVTLVVDASVEAVRADRELLRRVLLNLGENAIRHSPRLGVVTIRARSVEGAIELDVADRGHGVPADQRAHVFEPFVQLGGGERAASNRGLGLAFCKLAVEAHGGTIEVVDGDPGAIFRLRLPA